ncbi:MAG: nitrite/sulfite reductase [Terriglobales bacterium]
MERLKREQNPWEELPRLFSAMRAGAGAIAPSDLNLRLRWWGLYTQGDGEGAFGDAAPYFMLRIRVPNGLLTAAQAAGIAAIARRYARGMADVTVRQNIQLHWLDAETLPDVFHRLWDLGLTSQAACGDDPRNLTGCPLAGLDPAEHADASSLLLAANRALLATGDYYNLPRKFKVCISGCHDWCANPEINDVALTAFPSAGEPVKFGLRVGGGLSSSPMLAQALPVRVAWDQVVPTVTAVARLFREQDGLRQNRAYARLKFLFLKQGWTPERFVEELEARLGFQLERGEPDPPPHTAFRDHLGVHAQKQPGWYWVGASVLRGRLSADQLEAVAEIATRHGGGEVRATAMQNLILPHVPEANVDTVLAALEGAALPVQGSAFRRGTLSCTGKEFCKLAVTETKRFASELVEELERRMPGFPLPLRINLNGCPNSCGQHWIADVGLQGTRVKTPVGAADGFDVYLGGGLGAGARLARRTFGRVLASELPGRLEGLFRYFMAQREPGEEFRNFVEREGPANLEKVLGTLPAAEVLIRLREAGEEA